MGMQPSPFSRGYSGLLDVHTRMKYEYPPELDCSRVL